MEEGRNDGGRRKKRREEGTEEGRKGKEGENQRGRVIEEENWDIGREEAGGGERMMDGTRRRRNEE